MTKLDEAIRSALRGAEADRQAEQDTTRSIGLVLVLFVVVGVIALLYLLLWVGIFVGALLVAAKVILAFPERRKWIVPIVCAVMIPLGILSYHMTMEAAGDVHEFFTKEKAQRAKADARRELAAEQNRRANGAIAEGEKIMRAERQAGSILRRDHWMTEPARIFGRFVGSWNEMGIRSDRFNERTAYAYAFGALAVDYGLDPKSLPAVVADGPAYANALGDVVQRSWALADSALQAWATAAFAKNLEFSETPSSDAILRSVTAVREALQQAGFEQVAMSGSATLGQWLEKRLPLGREQLKVSSAYFQYLVGEPQSSDVAIVTSYLVQEAQSGRLPELPAGSLANQPFSYAEAFKKWRASAELEFNANGLKYQKLAFAEALTRATNELAKNAVPLDRAEKRLRLINRFAKDVRLQAIQKADPAFSLESAVDEILDGKLPRTATRQAKQLQQQAAAKARQHDAVVAQQARVEQKRTVAEQADKERAERKARDEAAQAARELLRQKRDFAEAWIFRHVAMTSPSGSRPDVTDVYHALAAELSAAKLPEALGWSEKQFAQAMKEALHAGLSNTGKVTVPGPYFMRIAKATTDKEFLKLALLRERQGIPASGAELVGFLEKEARLLPRIESIAYDTYHPDGWNALLLALQRRIRDFLHDIARERPQLAHAERVELLKTASRTWPETKKLERQYPKRFSLDAEIESVAKAVKK